MCQQRRQWHPTPVLLPGKPHGRRSLVGCSPWGHEELDMTEQLHFHFSLLCIGEGNGNPLQYSCLENPMDGKAWQAVVHGVMKSRKVLSHLTFTFTLTSNLTSLCSEKMPEVVSFFLTYQGQIYGPGCDLSWSIFQVHLRKR